MWFVLVLAAAVTPAWAQDGAKSPFAGRWDLTIKTAADTYPSWMEFAAEGGSPAGARGERA